MCKQTVTKYHWNSKIEWKFGMLFNRPFPSSLVPLFQSESNCETIFYENDFDLHENETAYRTHLHMKGFALRLVLKQRHKRTRKWPIQHTLNKDKSGKVKMRYLKNFLLVAEVIIYRKKRIWWNKKQTLSSIFHGRSHDNWESGGNKTIFFFWYVFGLSLARFNLLLTIVKLNLQNQ